MPEERHAAEEHALLAEITEPLSGMPAEPPVIAPEPDFPIVLRGYDRVAVDTYVRRTSDLLAELGAARSPDAAVRRALEQVGAQIAGILQRAHDTAAEITSGSRRESEDRLITARREAEEIVATARERLEELDAETDRVWAERERIVEETRALAQELLRLSESAAPPASTPAELARDREAAEFGSEAAEFGSEPDVTEADPDPDVTAPLPPPPHPADDPGVTSVLPRLPEDER